MSTTAFPINPELTAIAMAYRNPSVALIADQVLPRVPTAKKFNYTAYDVAQGYTIPDTKVGRKSQPNEVDFQGSLIPGECVDWGLDDIVPIDEVQAWEAMPKPAGGGGPIDPRVISTMYLEGLIQLDREVRTAAQVFSSSIYPVANVTALSGTSKWSDFVNSNPLNDLMSALDVPLLRPNKLVLGQSVWTKLRQNPKFVQAVYGTAQTYGVVDKRALAEKLEIEEVVVGAGWVNTARKGQAPNYQRVWGNAAALIYSDVTAAKAGQPTFGFTAQFGTKVAGTLPEPKMGLSGSERVRVGEKVIEVISAGTLGYLFQTPV